MNKQHDHKIKSHHPVHHNQHRPPSKIMPFVIAGIILLGIVTLAELPAIIENSSLLKSSITNNGPVAEGETITFSGICEGEKSTLIICRDNTICNLESSVSEKICSSESSSESVKVCSYLAKEEDIGVHDADVATCCDDEGICDTKVSLIEKWTVNPQENKINLSILDESGAKIPVTLSRQNTITEVKFIQQSIEKLSVTNLEGDTIKFSQVSRGIVEPEGVKFTKVVSFDLGNIAFTESTLTATATGTALYWCKFWDFDLGVCLGSWELVKQIEQGQPYGFNMPQGAFGLAEGTGTLVKKELDDGLGTGEQNETNKTFEEVVPFAEIKIPIINTGPVYEGETIAFTGTCLGNNTKLITCRDNTQCSDATDAKDLLCTSEFSSEENKTCSYQTNSTDVGKNDNSIATCCNDKNECAKNTVLIDSWSVLSEENADSVVEPIEIKKPVRWIKKIRSSQERANLSIKLPPTATNIKIKKIKNNLKEDLGKNRWKMKQKQQENDLVIEELTKDVDVEYTTPPPTATEETLNRFQKKVTIASDTHYVDIQAYTDIQETNQRNIRFSHLINGTRDVLIPNYVDTNGNGLIDRIEWIVPSLSEQVYLIEITKADHLGTAREFNSSIYNEVKSQNDVWSEPIYNNEYVRVVFEQNLTNQNDITLYARNTEQSNTKLEVYEQDSTEKVTEFPIITEPGQYRVLLTNLQDSQDTFDLKVVNIENGPEAFLEFDYIVDPNVISGNGTAAISAQICGAEFNQTTNNTFTSTCTPGSYPAECGATGDLTGCDEFLFINTTYDKSTFTGINLTFYNSSVTDCISVDDVQMCYEWWNDNASYTGTNCVINVDNDGEASPSAVVTTCPAATIQPGVTCVNVTTNDNWACGDFFGTTPLRSNLKAEISKSDPQPSGNLSIDVMMYNVTYTQDTTVPMYDNITQNLANGTVYEDQDPTTYYEFNSTWTDQITVDNVFVTFDGTNYSYAQGKVYNNSDSTVFSFNVTGLGIGDHNLTWFANDSINFENQTLNDNYTVLTNLYAPEVLNVFLNATADGNTTSDNLTVTFDSQDADSILRENNTDWRKETISIAVLNMPFDINVTRLAAANQNVTDYSTYGNNGTNPVSTLIWTDQGKIGGAYNFSGTTTGIIEPIQIGKRPEFVTPPFTISVWVNFAENVTARGTDMDILSMGNSGVFPGYSWKLNGDATNGQAIDIQLVDQARAGQLQRGTTVILPDTWYHIAAGMNDTNGSFLYINGVSEGSPVSLGSLMNGNSNLSIGGDNLASSGSTEVFNGTIDQVKIFNMTLTPDQIYQEYQAGLSGDAVTTLASTMLTVGDNWTVNVISSDFLYDSQANISDNLIVLAAASNSAPVVEAVDGPGGNTITDQSVTEDSITDLQVTFTVTDADGIGDLNSTEVNVTIYNRTYVTTDVNYYGYNTSCDNNNNISSTQANFTCTIEVNYWYTAGEWNITIGATDLAGASNENATNISIVETTAIIIDRTSVTFPTLTPGQENFTASNDPITMNNTANDYIDTNNVRVTGLDLVGEADPTYAITTGNFTVDIDNGGSPPAECTAATQLVNNTATGVVGSQLPAGNRSVSNEGAETIYFCLNVVPSGIAAQAYSTLNSSTGWTISVI